MCKCAKSTSDSSQCTYVGVSKKDLTDEKLLAENNFKYFSNALGPPVDLLVHNWQRTKTFHQIQEPIAHGERRADSAFIRSTAIDIGC